MLENIWIDDCYGLQENVMYGLAIKGTSWNQAINQNNGLDIFPYIYDDNLELRLLELVAEKIDDDENILANPPQKMNFEEWFRHYMRFFSDEKAVEELLNIPVKINDVDGFFVFAIGFPSEIPYEPRVECFFADHQSQKIQHITITDDTPLTDPNFGVCWQDHEFIKAIIEELHSRNHFMDVPYLSY